MAEDGLDLSRKLQTCQVRQNLRCGSFNGRNEILSLVFVRDEILSLVIVPDDILSLVFVQDAILSLVFVRDVFLSLVSLQLPTKFLGASSSGAELQKSLAPFDRY